MKNNKVEITGRLAIQNLVNAYCIELGKGEIIKATQQSAKHPPLSVANDWLVLTLQPFNIGVYIPLQFNSQLGQHQFLDAAYGVKDGQYIPLEVAALASLILADIRYCHKETEKLDSIELLGRWTESYKKLGSILSKRQDNLNDLFDKNSQNFIDTEQGLIYGHAMHPTPKARIGFDDEAWMQYSPEVQARFSLVYWLVHPDYVIEESADNTSISEKYLTFIKPFMDVQQLSMFEQWQDYKILPLHPWQAYYLKQKPFYDRLTRQNLLVELGPIAPEYAPTTSVRTLASFESPWMLKLSLSVAITNAVRINLPKECRRGLYATKIWQSNLGRQLSQDYPNFKVINDPAWIALKIDEEIVNETICIFRHQPFERTDNVSNLATLCQDHPLNSHNRMLSLLKKLAQSNQITLNQAATVWFDKFLSISLHPMLAIFHHYGMVFEAHQQNSVISINNANGLPETFWVRDNQSFGYVDTYAEQLVKQYPELDIEAHCVVPNDFANSRFIYYFIGNTLFSVITAIAKTRATTETRLLEQLQQNLVAFYAHYADSQLLKDILFNDTLPYKGNLLTRLYQLDELIAPFETQSIYVDIKNPIQSISKSCEF